MSMDSSSDAAVGASVTAAYAQPDADGKFGEYGGRYVAETLMHALDQLSELYTEATTCLLYTSPSPRDATLSRMPSSA